MCIVHWTSVLLATTAVPMNVYYGDCEFYNAPV